MWGFTQQEQRAILFLLVTFGIGCAILWYRRSLPPPPVERALLDSLKVYAHHVAPDTFRFASRDTIQPASKKRPGPIPLNTATLAELTSLPGIGEVLARRIVEYRAQHGKFARLEELERIKGLGKSKVEALKKYVIVP